MTITKVQEVPTLPNVAAGAVQWANFWVPYSFLEFCVRGCRLLTATFSEPFSHWSRKFEYPWVWYHGQFEQGQQVLDAGGGYTPLCYILANSGVKVTNLDVWTEHLVPFPPNLTIVNGDIAAIPFADGSFDRVFCISVLEHGEDPERMLDEMWRVLKPGGRLLVTLDVAKPALSDSPFDLERARELVARFGLYVPDPDEDALVHKEIFLGHELRVLCFLADKADCPRKVEDAQHSCQNATQPNAT